MTEFMLRVLIVGGIATLAALVLEQALLHARAPSRWAWTFALLLSVMLPFVPRLSEQPITEAVPVVVVPSIVVTVANEAEAGLPFNVLMVTWLLLVALAFGAYVRAYVRLVRVRKQWRGARMGDVEVFVSAGFGPAVFGFVRPRIVVPEWVSTAASEEQRLIALHEREHIRAGDQWQLLLSIVARVIMPWNPWLWLQSRRLGFRVETDCDARVLAVAPDAHRYAKLLLNVGAKQSGLLLMPALAEERTGLERRLHMLAKGIVRNRWKAAGLLALGAVLTVIACESRLPNEPQQPTPRGATSQQSLERKREGTAPQEPDAAALIQKYYPPLLREAGIGGVVGVEATVRTSGAVDNYRIVKSSGHDALDQAALRVVKEMKLMPYRVPVGQQPKDEVRSVYLYFNPKPSETRAPDATVLPPMKDITDEPVFTPYTEQPELQNRSEVGQSLVRNYPPTLRDAGIGGRSMVWLLLDERGQVINVKLKEGSGHEAIDAAAMRVAREMRFTPARNRGAAVKVWIVLPIVFKTN